MIQQALFGEIGQGAKLGQYLPVLSVTENGKGVVDCDTVKGCTHGMAKYPDGGCYGECYAQKTAHRYGIDFTKSVSRKLLNSRFDACFTMIKKHPASWYRIGTAGDPSHDWENTIVVCEAFKNSGKIPVIITKHWINLKDSQLERLKAVSAIINTSTSGMDTDQETEHRVGQVEHGRVYRLGVET